MAYRGVTAQIPLGQFGLVRDIGESLIPPGALISAKNIRLYANRVEKAKGSSKYNTTAIPGAALGLYDWWPTPSVQRLIAVADDNKAYYDDGAGNFSALTLATSPTSATVANTYFVSGGQEQAGNNRKLFIYTGSAPVQVLSGTATTTTNLATPPLDWGSNYPTFGIVYQGRHFGFGNPNAPHTLYWSTTSNHEDFTTTASGAGDAAIFPGEGDGLSAAIVYRGLLFLFKKPFGVYIFDGRDFANYQITKYSDAFGLASPHGIAAGLSDVIAANSFGSISSLQASDKFGDLESGDILANAQVEDYFRDILSATGYQFSHALYYGEKKMFLVTARSYGSNEQDRIIIIDVSGQPSKITLETKDQPTCLALRRDSDGIEKPMYGDNDGFVYFMDASTYAVGGAAYSGEFQLSYMDMSHMDPSLAAKNKTFDFVEVTYRATGSFTLFMTVYVDRQERETKSFPISASGTLPFILGTDLLAGESVQQKRIPIRSATGKRISLKFYNNSLNEYFKIEQIIISFRVSGEQSYS